MRINFFKNSVLSLAAGAVVVGCAKADYYERHEGVLGTLSATNDLVLREGERRDFQVQLTTGAPNNEILRWRLRSDKYIVKNRFKTPEGQSAIIKDRRDLIITVVAADVDPIRQGDQVYDLEIETSGGQKTTVPLTLLDVPVEPPSPVVPGPRRPGPERTVELDVRGPGVQPLVKVLLVMDNSWSMKKKQAQLAEGIRSIAKSLAGKNLQFFLYTTSNDHDEDGRFDKRTMETVKGRKTLHAPYQDAELRLEAGMPPEDFDRAVNDLQRNILKLGHTGSKNESALCTLNNILREKDPKKQILKKGDDALVFVLSDTDDHSRDVPVQDCGGTVSPRKIISSLDALLGRKHYGVTAVISHKFANKGHQCGDLILDEGVQYTALVKASPTPDRIFSICAKDYSEALESVNVFSRKSVVSEFRLQKAEHEEVLRVSVLRNGQEKVLAEEHYEMRGGVLRVSQKQLKPGDRLRVVFGVSFREQ